VSEEIHVCIVFLKSTKSSSGKGSFRSEDQLPLKLQSTS
jgi:hypothetical protein